MNFQLPDGTTVGTGLLMPPAKVSALPVYENVGPMLSQDDVIAVAKAGTAKGRDRFDSSYVRNQGNHGCHDDKTEVLTEKGWTKWTDYNWLDHLGTMNPVTGAMEYQPPVEKHVYDYDGPLFYTDHESLDFALTPNHRMFVRRWNEKDRTLSAEYQFKTVDDLGWYVGLPSSPSGFAGVDIQTINIPDCGIQFTGDDFLALVSLVVSDGWVGRATENKNRVSFCAFKKDKYDRAAALASRIGFKELPGRTGVWGRSDPALANWLNTNVYCQGGHTALFKRIPDIVKTVCERQVHLFLEYFGDQYVGASGRFFYSSSRRLIDDLQELLLRIGKRSGLSTRAPKDVKMADGREIRAENSHEAYALNEWKSGNLSLTKKKQVHQDHYKGQVFCAAVANGTLITRRNDKVLISGNSCNGFAGAWALTRARERRGLDRVSLSGAYLYSLINGNSDNGSMLEDGMKAMQQNGIATEGTVGVNQIYRSSYDRAKADAEAANYKGFECYAVRTHDGLFSALASGFDCVVAVHADNGFMSLDSRGVAKGGNGPGNHAVLADGLWWDNELIADGCNSWGLSYGAAGRMGLTWDQHFVHTTPYHVFYAVRSTTDGSDSPPVATS